MVMKKGLDVHDWKALRELFIKANDEQLIYVLDLLNIQFERRGHKK